MTLALLDVLAQAITSRGPPPRFSFLIHEQEAWVKVLDGRGGTGRALGTG